MVGKSIGSSGTLCLTISGYQGGIANPSIALPDWPAATIDLRSGICPSPGISVSIDSCMLRVARAAVYNGVMNKAFVREPDETGALHCPACGSLGSPVGA